MMRRFVLMFGVSMALSVFGGVRLSAAKADETSSIKSVNAAVDKLEVRISSEDKALPTLKVEYDFHDATEGVAPDFKFYFETKTVDSKEVSILRVCKTHIGLEVFSKDYAYYFDEAGRPMKYVMKNSGIPGESGIPSARAGLIYDKSGKVIWSSPGTRPLLSFKEVSAIFAILDGGLKKIH